MKKCSRCSKYFSDGQRDLVCCFHVAPWIDIHYPGKGLARIGVWSCCKEVSREAPGCSKGMHIEDKVTQDILRTFEVLAVKGTQKEAMELLDTQFLQKNLGSSHIHYMDHSYPSPQIVPKNVNNNNNTPPQAKKTPTDTGISETPEGYIKHNVLLTDTLPGIALRYHTTVAKLKQINKLFHTNDLYKLKTLLVPDPSTSAPLPTITPKGPLTTNEQIRQVNNFARVENICKEEALFYLSDNNWNVEQARESFALDVEWATAEWKRMHGTGKFKEWLGDSDVQTVAVVACGALLVLLCVLL